tara:strand:+ start:1791 stop:2624 length:834 start_codon:yes stop_codon:yes gene_type:complete
MKNLKSFGFNTKNSTYTIAEIGINHNGNFDLAKQLIQSASNAGADAVKFQTYITEKRVSKDSPIYEILKKCEFDFDIFSKLKSFAEKLNLDFFSTPFDIDSVDYLESIKVPLYKIASFDTVNKNFLKRISLVNKPIIISVGMTNLEEIKNAISILNKNNSRLAILHCISSYPTEEKNSNLKAIEILKNNFGSFIIGQSDHTNDIKVPIYAVCAGAQIIEKHFKIDESMECVDSSVSITQKQFENMVTEIRTIEEIFGNGKLGVRESEKGLTNYRRFS